MVRNHNFYCDSYRVCSGSRSTLGEDLPRGCIALWNDAEAGFYYKSRLEGVGTIEEQREYYLDKTAFMSSGSGAVNSIGAPVMGWVNAIW